jgi:hypothetical protein
MNCQKTVLCAIIIEPLNSAWKAAPVVGSVQCGSAVQASALTGHAQLPLYCNSVESSVKFYALIHIQQGGP